MKKCPYCAEEIQDEARVCKHCGRDLVSGASQVQLVQKKQTGCVAMGCAALLVLGVIGFISSLLTSTPPAPQRAGGPAAPAPGAPVGPTSSTGKWATAGGVSAADDTKTVSLGLDAENEIEGWLAKSVRPTLVLRCRERKTEAYVRTGMAANPELGEYQTASVLIRFDKAPAKTYRASESTDREALFLPGAVGLIKTMVGHERMLFRFTPFNASSQEASFDLRGLAQALPPLRKACGW